MHNESTSTPGMLIAGRIVHGSQQMDVIDPCTGETFSTAPRATFANVEKAIASAKAAFPGWAATPIEDRRAALNSAADILDQNVEELTRIFTQEHGRPVDYVRMEVQTSAVWMRALAATELPVEITEETEYRIVEVHRVPLGVVAGLVPWNFPITLAVAKITPALLTGNTLVLKPSPYTPLATLRMGELLKDVFPAGVLNVLSGDDDLGPMITGHPAIAKISFTGSTATGRAIMASAAGTLKRLTLELGGNDAAIVMPDVDVDAVAEKIFGGAFFNSGQICIATKRLYIHEDIYDALRDRLHMMAQHAPVGSGFQQGAAFGPIQNQKQYERVKALLADARAEGLSILEGGKVPDKGFFLPLTLIDNPPENSRVVQEEAFGPVLPLLKFTDVDEVVARANASEYGLAGSIWSADIAAARDIALRLETGTVWINDNLGNSPTTPFAGHKQSGLGAEYGKEGVLEYTVPKAIYVPKSAAGVAKAP